MDKLPPEILRGILGSLIALNPRFKNDILPFRLVCKVFNELLREELLKTIQLDFSRLERSGKPLDLKYLAGAANYCDAIYVDLTVIRDDGKSSCQPPGIIRFEWAVSCATLIRRLRFYLLEL